MLRQRALWYVLNNNYLSPALLAVSNWISIPWISCWNYSSAPLSLLILNKFFQVIIVIQILLDSWFALKIYCLGVTNTAKGSLSWTRQRNHINRGENAVCLSCLLPPHPTSLFEWEDLVMLTNFDKWQNARRFQSVLGLVFDICHSDLPPTGTHIQLGFSLTFIFPLLSHLWHTPLFWLTLGISPTESYSNCYKKCFIGFVAL